MIPDWLDDALCDALSATHFGKYDGMTVKVHLEHLIDRARAEAKKQPEWAPGRWWRATDPDGDLLCETSSEREARAAAYPGTKLERLWTCTDSEWRPAR